MRRRRRRRPECIGDEVPLAETDSGLWPPPPRPPSLPPLADEMGSILSPFRAGVVKAPKVGEFGSGGDGIGCAFWTSLSRRALFLVLGGGPVRFMQEVVLISAREFDLIRPCLV